MASFISSSERPGSRLRTWLAPATLALLLGFAACLAAGWLAQRWAGDQDRVFYYHWPSPASLGADVYFSYRDKDLLCHYDLYHDLTSSMAHAAQADILLLGNSEMQYGLRLEALREFHAATGIRIFNLGLGNAEGAFFPLEIIKRHQLRPKVVVVHGHNFFEAAPPTAFARKVMASDRWEAIKFFWEKRGLWNLALFWHGLLPRIQTGMFLGPQFLLYRSQTWGSWIILATPSAPQAVHYWETRQEIDPRTLSWAKHFQAELTAMGTSLILTHVPHPDTRLRDLQALAQELGVAVVAPRIKDGATLDGAHLDEASARRFAQAFFAQLLRLPEVEKLRRQP